MPFFVGWEIVPQSHDFLFLNTNILLSDASFVCWFRLLLVSYRDKLGNAQVNFGTCSKLDCIKFAPILNNTIPDHLDSDRVRVDSLAEMHRLLISNINSLSPVIKSKLLLSIHVDINDLFMISSHIRQWNIIAPMCTGCVAQTI